ncbi:MAG: hypothetical protein HQL72_11045 [Magnetococcales bacterium]|nr:hypothetical protein [Magnetococcales bacterium]
MPSQTHPPRFGTDGIRNLCCPDSQLTLGMVLFLSLLVLLIPSQGISGTTTRFAVIGDLPYTPEQADKLTRKGGIADSLSQQGLPFVIHYGDFKKREGCQQPLMQQRREQIYALHKGPVFYTPGDNDWTDCDSSHSGSSQSELESLAWLRSLFFPQPYPIPANWGFRSQGPKLPENGQWLYGDLLFSTLHIVGTKNGRAKIKKDKKRQALLQVDQRDRDNLIWLESAFDRAKKERAKGLVFVIHADLEAVKKAHKGARACSEKVRKKCDPYQLFRSQLMKKAEALGKPTLLIHGDTGPYCLEQYGQGKSLWRLNAAGDVSLTDPPDRAYLVDATIVSFDPEKQRFSAQTLLSQRIPAKGCPKGGK